MVAELLYVEPGYCECGCGEQTVPVARTDRRSGRVQGQPNRYIHGHQARGPATVPPNPSGLCLCGCGERTPIATVTRRPIGHVRGFPILYVNGHRARLMERIPPEERFWALVDRRAVWECWPYLGAKSRKGYGGFTLSWGHSIPAHRYAYELIRGPIPEGLVLDHLCRNPSCCNPWHLDPVPDRINILRGEGLAAQEARQTHCKRGHPFDEANTKLTRRGSRGCRACMRERGRLDARIKNARRRGLPPAVADQEALRVFRAVRRVATPR